MLGVGMCGKVVGKKRWSDLAPPPPLAKIFFFTRRNVVCHEV